VRGVAQHDFVHLGGALVCGHEPAADVNGVRSQECLADPELPQRLLRDRPPHVPALHAHLSAYQQDLAPPRKGFHQGQRVGDHHDVFQRPGLQAKRERFRQLQHRGPRIQEQPVPAHHGFRGCTTDEGFLPAAVSGGHVVGVVRSQVGRKPRSAVRADDLALRLQPGEQPPHRRHADTQGVRHGLDAKTLVQLEHFHEARSANLAFLHRPPRVATTFSMTPLPVSSPDSYPTPSPLSSKSDQYEQKYP